LPRRSRKKRVDRTEEERTARLNVRRMKFLIRLIINAVALACISYAHVAGVYADGWKALLIGAIVLGVVNAIIKPILIVISCPLEILTLGLFTLIINAIIFYFGLRAVPGWDIPSFWSAFLASIVLTIISWILSLILGENRKDTARQGGGKS
jgi:putative membrane protein